jgi:predicted short-subunit dehydrogenase-like oxidoreductase (DUF2520 family)
MTSVSIIGVGRVGGALAISLANAKYSIDNLVYHGRPVVPSVVEKLPSKPKIHSIDELSEISSDIIFISTPDSEIASVSSRLVAYIETKPFIFHTSGALSSAVLSDLKAIGCRTGSMHPLVSISSPELGAERFPGAYFCIEGEKKAVAEAETIVADLGGISFSIDTRFKTLYHAAAVTACGHLVALFDAAIEMMTKCGLDADEAKKVLMPLVKSTVQNLDEQSTASALTGTFARADLETFNEHLKTLNENVSDDLLEIYLLLGERSLELAARQGVSSEKIDSLRAKVSVAKSRIKW